MFPLLWWIIIGVVVLDALVVGWLLIQAHRREKRRKAVIERNREWLRSHGIDPDR